eukprot:TRINITY_DN864_c0_g1_i2.p1 TRINITY_DN864_c0_g1~~TRINITY_DN864_c0_g1_i2.p1  ORF type:complete len:325 (-),score=101.82 TRINITY_DN864_c0_g1_i2:220-1194(-)
MPLQSVAGPLIAKFRTPKIQKLYEEIGGGSPITRITEKQRDLLVEEMDRRRPASAPHKGYLAFRYSGPSTEEALKAMAADGVERAVAFSQYPQWACATTGSSLNELWRVADHLGMRDRFKWSIIDRWYDNEKFVAAVAKNVSAALEKMPSDAARDDAIILFSAHSLPIKQIDRGDVYPKEMGATVQRVMQTLGKSNHYLLCYQSQVGRVPWLGPQTDKVIEGYGKKGKKNLVVVPIAFTTDHVETLHEIDIEFAEVAHESGIENFIRAESLNTQPEAIEALTDVLCTHLDKNEPHSRQYTLRCPMCVKDHCRSLPSPIHQAELA